MQKLRTVLFRDGRPGHEKQSLGVAGALRQIVDLDVTEILLGPVSASKRALQWLHYYIAPHRLFKEQITADLVLGTGSLTHLHLLACKKITGARAVVCMQPSSLLINKFDLCLVPFHDRAKNRDNVFETVGPPNVSKNSQNKDPDRALILIGGENRLTGKWDTSDILNMLERLIAKHPEKRWTISTSPRTRGNLEKEIGLLLKGYDTVDYLPFANTGSGWVDQQYDINQMVWVTADSMSMIYEALSAGCRVGILPVTWKKTENKFRYSVDYLQSKNKVVSFDRYMADAWRWDENCVLKEADRCAREIIKRWWPKNLQ